MGEMELGLWRDGAHCKRVPDSEREGSRQKGQKLLCEGDEGSRERIRVRVLVVRVTTREKDQRCALTVGSVVMTLRDAGRSNLNIHQCCRRELLASV